MHRQKPLTQVVYNHLFPHPRPTDPASFAVHLSRNLIPEVRIETATFYGTLDTIEARYPGLDYSYGPHRMRLGRFTWHRRLFRAFDELRLTESEIAALCRWEGTKWARERYEADEGIKVLDTTGDEIPAWIEPTRRNSHNPADPACLRSGSRPMLELDSDQELDIVVRRLVSASRISLFHPDSNVSGRDLSPGRAVPVTRNGNSSNSNSDSNNYSNSNTAELPPSPRAVPRMRHHRSTNNNTAPRAQSLDRTVPRSYHATDEESEDEIESVGVDLNRRLLAAAEARERNGPDAGVGVVMDEEWEQWLKEAAERGALPDPTSAFRAAGNPLSSLVPPIPSLPALPGRQNMSSQPSPSNAPTGTAM
ncbi:MAG: hypothetical protein M1819_000707 [Sarea resinae]|nr:MAG: hypothetical protein M1819_000707 [Sarea resinae]